MNINPINDLNLTSSCRSGIVENNAITNNNDFFQQVKQLSETQTNQSKDFNQTKLEGADDCKDEKDTDLLTISCYPIDIQTTNQQILTVESTIPNNNQMLLITNNLNLEEVSDDNLFDAQPATFENEPTKQLLLTIHQSEELTNKSMQKTALLSESNMKIGHKFDQTAEIKTDINQKLMGSQSIANNKMIKADNWQIEFEASRDTTLNSVKETFFTAAAENKQNQIFPQPNMALTSLTVDLPTPMHSSTSTPLPIMGNIETWKTALTEKIIMLNHQDMQTAEIKLHPQEFGSLHIKLAMIDDKMNLQMIAAHTYVKNVLESALPTLRTSLEEQGIILEQTDISEFSMMNNADDQSARYQQTQNKQSPVTLLSDTTEQKSEQHDIEKNQVTKSGLSIFA
ncbi:hypothetical protein A9G48_01860 [Gilliamella sp. wkB18]|uniref:flagellar hook-length control protein FliK n=1 Tax=Gilliamella sp. wkB18 TaxID=3120260 RepID=UPI0004DD4EAF|nr:flagellar hook-length control protein FliK [Gilliamella apicola]KFA58362.1 Flagellar hook-length control protein FliK [Gilliamella apicola]OCG64764.1 hypothetical protein A9G48_01860 [Gilliamella apicola]